MTSRTWSAALAAGLALTTALTVPGIASANDGDGTQNIIGGTNATEDYPFAVRLLAVYPGLGTQSCTATLVTYRTITAVATNAHCVTDFETAQPLPATDITVQVGSTHLDQLIDITPTRVDVPAGWDWGTGDDAFADVAVLTLPTTARVAGIPIGHDPVVGRRVRSLGWGKTSIDATEPPPVLQQLDTRVTAPKDCAIAGIGAGEVCVGSARTGGQACFGDSGGPALDQAAGGWRLLGSASRETSADCTGATVYTDSTYWADWIKQAMFTRQPRRPRTVSAGAARRFATHLS